jgi:acetolactate synthase regulatory subunit
MTATEIYESVTNGGSSDFAEVAVVLDRYRPWYLIGALAVKCYVEPVYTVDVDLVVVKASLERIGRELEPAGFRVKELEPSMNAQRSGSKLNVQFTTDPRYQEFLDSATEREVLGMRVPVAGLKDLRGKVWAWQDEQRRSTKRKKVELDLMRIAEAHRELRRLIPEKIVKQL